MRAHISNKLLEGLRPKATPHEVWDTRLSGFLVRVQPSGIIAFVAQLGRGKRVTLGRYPTCTLGRARKLALDALQAAGNGADTAEVRALVRPKEGAALTLRGFVDDTYRAWLIENRKTGAAEAARIVAAFADLLDRPLPDLTAWSVERWRTDRLKAGTTPTTINRDLHTLKACLRRAVEWGVLDAYPLTSVKPSKADSSGKVRYLSHDEETALRATLVAREARMRAGRTSGNAHRDARGVALLPAHSAAYVDHLAPMVLISLNTGLRRGELFALRWRDVDLRRRLLTVAGASAKSGSTRHVPMSDEAHEVLKAWQAQAPDPDGLVFPGRTGKAFHTLKTAWGALLDEAGIAAFRWHDMRHSFASKLVQASVDLNTVRELLGHADITMTLRYAHLAPSHLQDAVAKLRPATTAAVERLA